MENYLKIFVITGFIQIGGFYLGAMGDGYSLLGDNIWLASFPISIVIGVILACCWGKSLKQKLVYIFLMPSNYTGVVLAISIILRLSRCTETGPDLTTEFF